MTSDIIHYCLCLLLIYGDTDALCVCVSGVRMISLSYSRISLADIAQKLQLDSPEDAEFIVAKVTEKTESSCRQVRVCTSRQMLSYQLRNLFRFSPQRFSQAEHSHRFRSEYSQGYNSRPWASGWETCNVICARVLQAIRDGVIEASINHEKGFVQSKETMDIYGTREPQLAFHQRISFCLDIHNMSVKVTRSTCL